MLNNSKASYPSLEGGNEYPMRGVSNPISATVDRQLASDSLPPESEPMYGEAPTVDWVGIARNAFDASESWMQVNTRSTWAKSMAHYHSQHAADSPALLESNKSRANYFWPKSRTLVRAIQAAACSAFFTSADVVAIEAEDQDDGVQREAASFMRELINYRLAQTIPWYQLLLGGVAEAAVLGTIISHQSWEYDEEITIIGLEVDPVSGETFEIIESKTKKDEPAIRLVPAENLRLSAAANWLDPINSSPYLIELIPMFLGDVQDKIEKGALSDSEEAPWKNVGMSALLSSSSKDTIDTVANARAGRGRIDPKTLGDENVDAFKIVWIHRNIVRRDGKDWLFYTVGTNTLLSDPVPLANVIPWAKGKRDYALGKMEVEVDKVYSSSPVEIISGMQKAVNELKNQRYDNVRQVLNRRYLYRQGNQVDVRALARNAPGSLIGISATGNGSLDNYVTPLPTQDVTGSSYQEEDRIALAMDDLSGSMAGSTVNANRKMNETVGGMQLMQEAGNQVREMELRTVTKTWVENVIKQLVQLEAMYETDETVMKVALKKAKLLRITSQYFDHNFAVRVNVGMGAVSPTQRMQKIQSAVTATVSLIPDAAIAINGREIAKEIFGAAGYDNGDRFFNFDKVDAAKAQPQEDPQIALAREQMEQKAAIENGKLQIAQAKLQLENAKLEASVKEMEAKINLILAQTDAAIAQTTTTNVTAVYEATQAAGVIAQNPGAAVTADGILLSAGFVDHNPAPVIPQVIPQIANPGLAATPDTPGIGKKRGIETERIEPLGAG